jgi:hypothetical protein
MTEEEFTEINQLFPGAPPIKYIKGKSSLYNNISF